MRRNLVLSCSLFLFSLKIFAYADFVSYGYKSCVTCHYNGHGSGALNDYGRALFASEFTARHLTDQTDDQLGESSGFLGQTKLPAWLRPALKTRSLWLRTGIGSAAQVNRFIQMQTDLNLTFPLSQRQDHLVSVTYGYVPTPSRLSNNSREQKPPNWNFKDYFYRFQSSKNFWTYLGFMDKVYGIRHPDHSAFNKNGGRTGFGLDQNDQTHGLILQYDEKKYDLSAHIFLGNLSQDSDLRQKGFTLRGEYFFNQTLSIGGSHWQSSNDYLKMSRSALHSRVVFAKGKSIFAELGLREDSPKAAGSATKLGAYTYIQSMINLVRGYNFFTVYQVYKDELKESGTTRNRLGLGLLSFPWAKTEFRTEIINERTTAIEQTSPDSWLGQIQLHTSW